MTAIATAPLAMSDDASLRFVPRAAVTLIFADLRYPGARRLRA